MRSCFVFLSSLDITYFSSLFLFQYSPLKVVNEINLTLWVSPWLVFLKKTMGDLFFLSFLLPVFSRLSDFFLDGLVGSAIGFTDIFCDLAKRPFNGCACGFYGFPAEVAC